MKEVCNPSRVSAEYSLLCVLSVAVHHYPLIKTALKCSQIPAAPLFSILALSSDSLPFYAELCKPIMWFAYRRREKILTAKAILISALTLTGNNLQALRRSDAAALLLNRAQCDGAVCCAPGSRQSTDVAHCEAQLPIFQGYRSLCCSWAL